MQNWGSVQSFIRLEDERLKIDYAMEGFPKAIQEIILRRALRLLNLEEHRLSAMQLKDIDAELHALRAAAGRHAP